MKDVEYGYETYGKIDPIGEKVLIKKLKKDDFKFVGGIYCPESKEHQNAKIGCGQIIDIGEEAKTKYFLNVGDYVLYDYYSAFGDWPNNIITNGENVIAVLDESEVDPFLNGELEV